MALLLGEAAVRVVAWWSPAVRELAVRDGRPHRRFASLEAYLATRAPEVVPHRNWLNHWNNALGLNDEEFTATRLPGRFRILAVGDSFTYGMVPYPDAVMTRLESALRAACPARDPEVLNLGIGSSDVEDYRAVATVGIPRFAPDLVVVHLFAGNDPPDLYRLVHERAAWTPLFGRSRLWTLARNVVRLRREVEEGIRAAAEPAAPAPGGPPPRGGAVVDPRRPLPPDDPALVGPTFRPAAFDAILGGELRRLYVPPDPAVADRAWAPVLAALEAIHRAAAAGGSRLALVHFPSVLQVDPGLRAALVARLRARRRYAALRPEAVDPGLPPRRLAAYCARAGLPCIDVTPALVAAREARPDAPLYKQGDTHWTVRGNRVAAEAEAAALAPLVCPG